MSERVDRVTGEFEDQFQTAVQFRLDDFLWEQESLKEQRLAMRSRLKASAAAFRIEHCAASTLQAALCVALSHAHTLT